MKALAALVAMLVLVAGILGMEVRAQKASLAQITERVEQQKTTIAAMEKVGAGNAKAISALQLERERIRAAASVREQTLQDLQNENTEIHRWADDPLPDAIASLLRRPALTGSRAFHQRLSGGDPLQPAGEQALE